MSERMTDNELNDLAEEAGIPSCEADAALIRELDRARASELEWKSIAEHRAGSILRLGHERDEWKESYNYVVGANGRVRTKLEAAEARAEELRDKLKSEQDRSLLNFGEAHRLRMALAISHDVRNCIPDCSICALLAAPPRETAK